MALKRLGTLLVEEGLITEPQLEEALQRQRQTGEALGEALVALGHLTEESLYRFLAIQHGLEYQALDGVEIPPQLARMIPAPVAWKYKAVPLAQDNGSLTFATSQPDDLSLFYFPKELKLPPDLRLKFLVAPASQITALLKKHFPQTESPRAAGAVQAVGEGTLRAAGQNQTQLDLLAGTAQELVAPEDINLEILEQGRGPGDEEGEEGEGGDEGPIIKLCEYLIAEGVRRGASDIHLTPYEKKMVLKYRIDGSLIEFPAPPLKARRQIATRFKIMSKTMNIIERRLPQDGRIHLTVGGRPVDLRISTMPTRWGENLVMRIVDQHAGVKSLDDLGMEPDQLEHFKRAISQPYGMVFVTGPTASGKTTTLFAALHYINTPTKNIVTVEDPVEYRLPYVVQIQVDPAAGRTFASVLRAFLRHDPNVMLVGEIRDSETASIANKAALTGHLVLSSLHTNDAASSVMRLVDLGVDHVYVGSSVLCFASQRLIRRICEACKEPVSYSAEELARVGLTAGEVKDAQFFRGKGCAACHQTGYKGRIGIFEVMPVTASIREVIFSKGTLAQIKNAARAAGFKSIRDAAIAKWRKGLTTLEEVLGETFE